MPLVIRHLRSAPEADDELREQCLQVRDGVGREALGLGICRRGGPLAS